MRSSPSAPGHPCSTRLSSAVLQMNFHPHQNKREGKENTRRDLARRFSLSQPRHFSLYTSTSSFVSLFLRLAVSLSLSNSPFLSLSTSSFFSMSRTRHFLYFEVSFFFSLSLTCVQIMRRNSTAWRLSMPTCSLRLSDSPSSPSHPVTCIHSFVHSCMRSQPRVSNRTTTQKKYSSTAAENNPSDILRQRQTTVQDIGVHRLSQQSGGAAAVLVFDTMCPSPGVVLSSYIS